MAATSIASLRMVFSPWNRRAAIRRRLRPQKSAVWVGGSGRSADSGSTTALSSSGANKNASTFSIGRGKYFRTACSNDLQISSALSGEDFVVTALSSIQVAAMTRRETVRRLSASGPRFSRLLMGRRNHAIAVSLMHDSNQTIAVTLHRGGKNFRQPPRSGGVRRRLSLSHFTQRGNSIPLRNFLHYFF